MVTATASLLWAACRPATAAEDVRAAIEAGADLPVAADIALSQRVSPLLWRALVGSGAVPDEGQDGWQAVVRRDAARCRAEALLVLPRLGPYALAPLNDAGLTPLVFKGGALADRYPEAGLRPMDDIDLVLPPDQLGEGVAALERGGWRVVEVPIRRHHHEVTLAHDELPGLPVELHRALATWRERSNHLTAEDLWRWRRPGRVSGAAVFVLPREEEIVALAAHAAKPFHVFARLIWAVDVAVAILDASRAGTPLDWDKVADLAAAARCRTALAVALSQAYRLGAPSPAMLRDCPASGARARALVSVLSPEWPVLDRGWSTRTRLRYALVDDWRQRVTLLAGQVLENGATAAPGKAVDLGARGLRRWWRLRRKTGYSRAAREDGGEPVKP